LDWRANIRKALWGTHWELGEHIGNMVGICWENKYKKFHHHISPLPLPKETKKKYEALFVVKMVILHTKILKKSVAIIPRKI
jgi:hypothetical protein